MKNRKLLLIVSVVLALTMSLGGTLAYLTDTDADVNVMTLGSVKIEQHEYQRKVDENGNYVTDETGYVLEPFKQYKPLLPADLFDGDGKPIWDTTTINMSQVDSHGTSQVFASKNAQDKFVTVENTGKSDAYVRTLVAFEMGTIDPARHDVVFGNTYFNAAWTSTHIGQVEINGNYYYVNEYVYTGGKLSDGSWVHQNGILPAGETTYPNLSQVCLAAEATNEDCEKIDGNGNGQLDILVLSQAVQAQGFADADTALTAGFGKVTADNAAIWFSGVMEENTPPTADTWDGTADTSWYNDTDTEFTIMTAEQLAGFAKLVDDGNNFAGKTVKLGKNIDLTAVDTDGNRINFNPIGHSSSEKSFNGTFNGQDYIISNLYRQNDLEAWQYEGEYYALFAYTNGATIENVTVADAYISSGRNEAAGVVGNAVDTTFENISIKGTTLIGYNNSVGGVAAECYGECSFTNITVDDKTVIGPLWGTYDVRLGGVVGMVKSSDKVSFSKVSVSCQLDAINDVAANYQWYNYRYSGMLIGQVDGVNGVADPTGYVTCENVTVTYGDWVNYHYCEDSSYGTPSYAQPGQYKFNRVEAGTGTNGIDLSTCDHDENETHNLLIVFDQLFGGGQGVSGLKTYDGVTVIYPN